MQVHGTIIARLVQAHRRGRLGHALLLAGGGGHGAYDLAIRLAEMLLCPESCTAESEPCPICRQVRKLSHPDLLVLSPLPTAAERRRSEDERDPVVRALAEDLYAPLEVGANWGITAEQARRMIQWAALTPWEARGKMAIMAEADRVTEPTADILLKTLEEPPASMTIILVTARPQDLLPTVRSRCQEVRVPPLGEEAIVALLVERGVGEDEARAVAPLANGDLWQARALLGGGASRLRDAARHLVHAALDPNLTPADVVAAAQAASEGASAGEVSELVRWIMWRLRDLVLAAEDAAPAREDLAATAPLARKLGPARLMRWLDEADRAYDMLGRNVTPGAVIAALLLFPRDERRLGTAVTFPPLDVVIP